MNGSKGKKALRREVRERAAQERDAELTWRREWVAAWREIGERYARGMTGERPRRPTRSIRPALLLSTLSMAAMLAPSALPPPRRR